MLPGRLDGDHLAGPAATNGPPKDILSGLWGLDFGSESRLRLVRGSNNNYDPFFMATFAPLVGVRSGLV